MTRRRSLEEAELRARFATLLRVGVHGAILFDFRYEPGEMAGIVCDGRRSSYSRVGTSLRDILTRRMPTEPAGAPGPLGEPSPGDAARDHEFGFTPSGSLALRGSGPRVALTSWSFLQTGAPQNAKILRRRSADVVAQARATMCPFPLEHEGKPL